MNQSTKFIYSVAIIRKCSSTGLHNKYIGTVIKQKCMKNGNNIGEEVSTVSENLGDTAFIKKKKGCITVAMTSVCAAQGD